MILERLKRLWGSPECQHNWEVEKPSLEIGGILQMWDGPLYDYCTKCGKKRTHPECEHDWLSIGDDGRGPIVNGEKMVLVAKCSLCGASHYEMPG